MTTVLSLPLAIFALASCGGSAVPAVYLRYDGLSDAVEVPSDPGFSVSAQGLTVAAWMRPDALTFPKTEGSDPAEQYVHWLGKGKLSLSAEWTFRMYSQPGPRANRISFYVFEPGVRRGCGSYFQDPLVAGEWIHVAGVVDASAQQTSIYKNGVFRHADSYATLTLGAGTEPLRIGTRDLASFFQGAIGRLQIWSRPLSAPEISGLFSGQVPRSGLVAEYPFDEGSGSTVHDDIAGHHGHVVSGTWQRGSGRISSGSGESGGGC